MENKVFILHFADTKVNILISTSGYRMHSEIILNYIIMKRLLYLSFFLFLLSCNNSNLPKLSDFDNFYKPQENPVLKADSSFTFICPVRKQPVKWQKADVFNPAAILKDNKVYLLYRCEDNPAATLGGRTSRIGLAVSTDGIHFDKFKEPVLYPDSDNFLKYEYFGGCEDPRIVETEDSTYVVCYSSWNYDVCRLSVAFSKDLLHWEKKGPAFAQAYDGKFMNLWSKSGALITRMVNGKQIASKINGKYWMYWGDLNINLAWSDNLSDWNPSVDEKGELKYVAGPRKGKFDSGLAESGPPALITNEGIMLIYNGKNADNEDADPKLPKGMYSVGKIIFDVNNPGKLISRSDTCFLKPTLPHEVTGQYSAGTTFAEGLVFFQNKWFLYYGTADSFVGVAINR